MVAPLPPDPARLAAIREALPALAAGIYLNTAAAGPLPSESAGAMATIASAGLTLGRAHAQDPLETLERIGEARAGIAAILGADLDAVGLTRGTAHGLALGLAAIDWRPGDRVVVLAEPGDPNRGWPLAGLMWTGTPSTSIAIDERPDEAILLELERALAEGARAVVLPHVAPASGRLLPVSAVAARAHAVGALALVDGGHAVGAIPIEPQALGADLIVFPAERWLLGPGGLGGLWGGPRMLDRLRMLEAPAFGDAFTPRSREADWVPSLSGWDRPGVVGVARSCGWLAMHVGMPWAWSRARELAAWLLDALAGVGGVTMLTPRDPLATIVTFRIAGWDAEAALDELGPRIFAMAGRAMALGAIRVSVGGYNSAAELARFVEGVALLAAHSPATLPPRRTLDVLP